QFPGPRTYGTRATGTRIPAVRKAKFMGFVHRGDADDAEKVVSGIEAKSQTERMFAPRLLCEL
ncbi:TPA: hypothetical protein DCY67_03580, partial [Candidatus Acetothermia bacterium]|nr:hypothetical protein [Candidatus Acetothermia bacterium]